MEIVNSILIGISAILALLIIWKTLKFIWNKILVKFIYWIRPEILDVVKLIKWVGGFNNKK
ncbi:hypothetical protein CMT22_17870 [Elizabethkingia anophelis]|nr:hypothetical protein [Elizabethkingia anophelis]